MHPSRWWVNWWAWRFDFWLKRLEQFEYGHMKGFSPVWIRMCVFKLKSNENLLLQRSHLYGFSPVWTSICLLSFALSKNRFPQPSWVHWKSLSPWTVLCFFKLALSWKILPHDSSGHLKTFGYCWAPLPFGRRPTSPRARFFRSPPLGWDPGLSGVVLLLLL